jgi:hypothetical protein
MKDVDDVWWCRTPKNSVVYGSGERRIAVSGVSHYISNDKIINVTKRRSFILGVFRQIM